MSFTGKLLFRAQVCIVSHSICCLSAVGSVDMIWYAAILCSAGWLEQKLIVVSVVVGFRHMSVSRLVGFRIIKRSRKLMLLLLSCVGLSWRFGCNWFMYL